jgi:serine/threonine-protein kinase
MGGRCRLAPEREHPVTRHPLGEPPGHAPMRALRFHRPRRLPTEAGPTEAGPSEAGPSEAGLSEAGLSEAGLSEAGLSEAGLSGVGLSGVGLSAVFDLQCRPSAVQVSKLG